MGMSRYEPLWQHVSRQDGIQVLLSFSDIEKILGFPLDHSFLNSKKELLSFGWQVMKISMKEKTVRFGRFTQ